MVSYSPKLSENSRIFFIVLLFFSLIGIDYPFFQHHEEKAVLAKVDIREFTKAFEKTPEPVMLSSYEKENSDLIVKTMNFFNQLSFDSQTYKVLKQYALKEGNDFESSSENQVMFFKDGSNVDIHFEHALFPMSSHEMVIRGLSQKQCHYFSNLYQTNPDVLITHEMYRYTANGVSTTPGMTCDIKDPNLALVIHSAHLVNSKQYHDIEQNYQIALNNLTSSNPVAIESNVYYSTQAPHSDLFLKGVDYLVNPETQKVWIGALNYDNCKKIVYDLNVNHSFKTLVTCSNQHLNTIELIKNNT